MPSSLRVAAFALVASSCFTPVPEAQCSTDADCTGGLVCLEFRCRAGDGGSGSTGGGAAGGDAGGAPSGGGDAGGTAGGGAGGGATAGGSAAGGAGGGAACGCRTGTGQCQVGDSPLACGANGAMCTRCGNGEQCVNGACVMAPCGPGTCTGCCARNFCVTSANQSSISCGTSGSMCMQCPRGQDCINGTCQQAMGCGPMTCASGCCLPGVNRCMPYNQQSRFTCGTAGAQCAMCPGGSQCTNGVCGGGTTDAGTPPSCDATTCPTGCCAFGRCVTGNQQSNFACGSAGQMCTQCTNGTTCRMGACVPNTQPDGGIAPLLPTGSACTAASSCEGFCLEESQFGQPTGYPGGYCTNTCGAIGGMGCGASGLCVTEQVFGQPVSQCRSTCTGAGTGQGSCRQGYVCTLAPNPGALVGYCRPNCNNGGLAMCASGQCQMNGYCM